MEYVGENGIQDLRQRVFKRRGQVVLDAQGQAVLAFDPPIILDREPFVQLTPRILSGSGKVACNVLLDTFTTNESGAYTGVTIEGARLADKLPTLQPVSGALLTNAITAINNIVTALSGFKPLDDGAANGVAVDWQAT